MRYKNIKTGVFIETTSKIIGKAWKKVEDNYHNQEGEVISSAEEVPTKEVPEEEYVEEEVDLEQMTNKELETFAKEHGVELTTADKQNKESRISAIAKAFE